MIKYLLVFLVGVVETYFSTNWALYATDRKLWASSVMMFLFILLNGLLITWAAKDKDTVWMVMVYATSCGVGNFLSVKLDLMRKNVAGGPLGVILPQKEQQNGERKVP